MGLRNAIHDMGAMKLLLTEAEREARALGEESPGPEHLLLAALAAPDASGRDALAASNITVEDVRRSLAETRSAALRSVGIDTDAIPEVSPGPAPRGPYRATGSANDVFQRAIALAKSARPKKLRTAHVVIAVAELEHGTAARALRNLGVAGPALVASAHAAVLATP
ncbi:Clp protease N-terminal domain-containing protein [Streptomyces sp. SID3343]|uniref:Clp protease N-terminal domain-containing protein n=1 Tax=Streptomyces sp. SID3343 TaxID=2690260 RepID=UPI00136E9123|nr:Clp protease N-terminal domain-containing protein [Streptomyces sp. SID3343]MYW00526.1 Clp protease [Streptomyces sp. SID3343]